MRYNYSIAFSPVNDTDLVRDFVRSTRQAGIAPGFYCQPHRSTSAPPTHHPYPSLTPPLALRAQTPWCPTTVSSPHTQFTLAWYSLPLLIRSSTRPSVLLSSDLNVANGVVGNTTSPGQVSVNQSTYDAIVLAQLTELWSAYGQLEGPGTLHHTQHPTPSTTHSLHHTHGHSHHPFPTASSPPPSPLRLSRDLVRRRIQQRPAGCAAAAAAEPPAARRHLQRMPDGRHVRGQQLGQVDRHRRRTGARPQLEHGRQQRRRRPRLTHLLPLRVRHHAAGQRQVKLPSPYSLLLPLPLPPTTR